MFAAKRIALLLAFSTILSASAKAEPIKLVFATTVPAGTALVTKVFEPWAARVNAAGAGTIGIEIRNGPSVANLSNYYDRVAEDVVQIVFGMQGLIGGRFPLSAAAGLPYVVDDAVTGSVAFWRLYKSGLLDAEYKDLKPVMLGVLPQSRLHFVRAPKSIAETVGMKLVTSGKERSELVRRLGYAPISGSSSDMYTMLQRHLADGIVSAWPALDTFKLAEVTTYHLNVPLGGSTSIVFLTAKRFAALPPAAQKAIEENSDETQSRNFGIAWEETADDARAMTQRLPGHVFAQLDDATARKWRNEAEPVLDEWAQANPGGKEVLAKFRELIAAVQAGK
jgi:TRAP-type C4-dicarboxylate transport system substrate-binding protein